MRSRKLPPVILTRRATTSGVKPLSGKVTPGGCALRRRELASLKIEDIQLREGRWVIIDLRGKGGRIRTVAVPIWVKQAIEVWMAAANIDKGRLLRPLSKSGKIVGDELGDWRSGP